MNPAQRIEAITSAANALEGREWAEIDLILGQFGFHTTEQWSGNVKAYCIEMLQSGSDSELLELVEYLGHGVGELGVNGPWEADSLRLFLSHLSSHADFVSRLKTALRHRGIDGFVAHADIAPSQDWQDTIISALRTCDALAALLHPGFSESLWTDQEVGAAVGRSRPIVPMVFDKMAQMPYGFLGSYQAMFGKDLKPSEIAKRTLKVLIGHPSTREKGLDAAVVGLARSPNFDTANEQQGFLDLITDWSPVRVAWLHEAAKNAQVTGAFVAGPKVKAVLEKLDAPPF